MWRSLPRMVAVAIRGEDGASFADILKKARGEISLEEIGAPDSRVRRAQKAPGDSRNGKGGRSRSAGRASSNPFRGGYLRHLSHQVRGGPGRRIR